MCFMQSWGRNPGFHACYSSTLPVELNPRPEPFSPPVPPFSPSLSSSFYLRISFEIACIWLVCAGVGCGVLGHHGSARMPRRGRGGQATSCLLQPGLSAVWIPNDCTQILKPGGGRCPPPHPSPSLLLLNKVNGLSCASALPTEPSCWSFILKDPDMKPRSSQPSGHPASGVTPDMVSELP